MSIFNLPIQLNSKTEKSAINVVQLPYFLLFLILIGILSKRYCSPLSKDPHPIGFGLKKVSCIGDDCVHGSSMGPDTCKNPC